MPGKLKIESPPPATHIHYYGSQSPRTKLNNSPNFSVAPPLPSCVVARDAVPAGIVGAFVPSCKKDGSYNEKQCHGSTGHCWCVDKLSGKEIKGTRKGLGTGMVECGGK